MNVKEKKIDKQIELWSLLGPFIMVMTLTIVLINPAHHQLYVPLAALLGLPICWKWKLPGLAISLGILGAFVTYQFFNSSANTFFWDFTLAIAVALTFCITALSYGEVENIITGLQQESSSRLHQFLHAGEKIKEMEGQLDDVNGAQQAKIILLEKILAEKSVLLQSYEMIVNTAREEILYTNKQNESLLQELFQKRHQCVQIEEQYEDLSTAQEYANHELLQLNETLKEELDQKNQESELLKLKHDTLLYTHASADDREIRRLEGLYYQIKEQFEERNKVLDQTRHELFLAQETVLKQQIEIKEKDEFSNGSNVEFGLQSLLLLSHAEILNLEQNYIREIEGLHAIVEHLMSSSSSIKASPVIQEPIQVVETINESKAKTQKKKPAKPTKTTHWANTILSRCATPETEK